MISKEKPCLHFASLVLLSYLWKRFQSRQIYATFAFVRVWAWSAVNKISCLAWWIWSWSLNAPRNGDRVHSLVYSQKMPNGPKTHFLGELRHGLAVPLSVNMAAKLVVYGSPHGRVHLLELKWRTDDMEKHTKQRTLILVSGNSEQDCFCESPKPHLAGWQRSFPSFAKEKQNKTWSRFWSSSLLGCDDAWNLRLALNAGEGTFDTVANVNLHSSCAVFAS